MTSTSRHTTPKTMRKHVPLADIDAYSEKHHQQESTVPAQSKAGKRPASKTSKRCTGVEEVSVDIVTPEKKKRKIKQTNMKLLDNSSRCNMRGLETNCGNGV